jgi:microcin C transport system ATP-binding protein
MSAPPLDVRHLTVSFGARRVVDDVSFIVPRGETLAIVGESGSGKTVTAQAIVRLAQGARIEGQALVGGADTLTMSDRELRALRGARVTMVFQEPMTSLNPLHTLERQIAEIIQLHGGRGGAVRARVVELLTEVGLPDPDSRLGAFPHQLSGGQRQRVMIAMALANRPDLLIADEPTTALDVTVQAQILALLRELQGKYGLSILFITHDLNLVRRFARHLVVMQAGRVVEAGETAATFAAPKHPYTKMLIAAAPHGSPPPSDPAAARLITVDNLKVWFPIREGAFRRTVGHVKAVDGVSLTISAGRTLGLVGESGSGKTTLGLALLRLIRSEGPITFKGQRLDSLSRAQMRPLRRQMQIVFQDPFGSLSPRMSVAEIVEEGLVAQNLKLGERREAVARALADVGLEPETMDRYPHEFSGGQRQRIAIARAMALDPEFVVLDEPTSALDKSVRSQIVDLLADLQKRRNLAYLFISHDLEVVRALASDVIVMKAGRVVESGPAQQIFNHPREAYTQALMQAALAPV